MHSQGNLANYHTHCNLCDGKGELEDYVRSAVELGFVALGFTSHAPLPFPVEWVMAEEDLPLYCATVRRLQSAYADKLQIYLGLEIDYIQGVIGPSDPKFAALGLDYTVGSVHFVRNEKDGKLYGVDAPPPEFAKSVEVGYGGDAEPLVHSYYHSLRGMLQEHKPDIIGHIDVVRKSNRGNRHFDESAAWYRAEVMKTLDVVEDSEAILEVNTGAMVRGYTDTPYPDAWILAECRRRDVPMMLNADAHDPARLTAHMDVACRAAYDAGYRSHYMFLEGAWREQVLVKPA